MRTTSVMPPAGKVTKQQQPTEATGRWRAPKTGATTRPSFGEHTKEHGDDEWEAEEAEDGAVGSAGGGMQSAQQAVGDGECFRAGGSGGRRKTRSTGGVAPSLAGNGGSNRRQGSHEARPREPPEGARSPLSRRAGQI